MGNRGREPLDLAAVVAAAVAASAGFAVLGLPSPALFAGLVRALGFPGRVAVPGVAMRSWPRRATSVPTSRSSCRSRCCGCSCCS